MGDPGAPNGPNSKNFVFGRRDFIFTQYVPFYVRKNIKPKKNWFSGQNSKK